MMLPVLLEQSFAEHRLLTSIGVLSLIVFILALGLFISLQLGNDTDTTPEELRVRTEDWVRGNPSAARVTLIEYSDFECPVCSMYHATLKQLESEANGNLVLVYRHFPLSAIHPHAELAARAAEAAGVQGKFFEMHDRLFEEQKAWSKNESPREIFIEYARGLGLDEGQFVEKMDSEKTLEKIEGSVAEARALGAKGTPTFFMNGKPLPLPATYAEFKREILKEVYPE